jgi:hypothetical protein
MTGAAQPVLGRLAFESQAITCHWLLVRLPSPEMPPSTVKLPEYETAP